MKKIKIFISAYWWKIALLLFLISLGFSCFIKDQLLKMLLTVIPTEIFLIINAIISENAMTGANINYLGFYRKHWLNSVGSVFAFPAITILIYLML